MPTPVGRVNIGGPSLSLHAVRAPNPLSPYAMAIMADGPVAYYRMDDAGTVCASLMPGTDGVFVNAGHYTLGVTGLISHDTDTAASFDGAATVGGTVRLPAFALGDGPFTVECWAKRGALSGNGKFPMMTAFDNGLEISFTPSDNANPEAVSAGKAGTGTFFTSTTRVNDTTTAHHIVVTKNGATTHIYIDGVDQANTSGTNLTLANGAFPNAWIASDYNSTNPAYNGVLDEVAIYNYVLNQAQVSAHYTLTSLTFPLPLSLTQDQAGVALKRALALRSAAQGTSALSKNQSGWSRVASQVTTATTSRSVGWIRSATQIVTAAAIKQGRKTLSPLLSETATLANSKAFGRILTLTQAQTASLANQTKKVVSLTQTAAPTIIKAVRKTSTITQASAVTLAKSLTRTYSASQATVITIVRQTLKVGALTQVAQPTIVKRVTRSLTISQATVATVVRALAKALSTPQATTAALARSTRKMLSPSQATTATTIKFVAHLFIVIGQSQIATMLTTKVKLITLTATQATSALLTRSARVIRVTSAPSGATLVRSARRSLAAVAAQTTTLTRSTRKPLTLAQAQVATFARGLAKGLILNVTQAQSALLGRRAQITRTAAQAETSTLSRRAVVTRALTQATLASGARLVRITRSPVVTGVASFVRGISVTRSATQVTTGSTATNRALNRIFSAVSTVIATVNALFRRGIPIARAPGTLTVSSFTDVVWAYNPVTDQQTAIRIEVDQVVQEIPFSYFEASPLSQPGTILDSADQTDVAVTASAQTITLSEDRIGVIEAADDLILTLAGNQSLSLPSESLTLAARAFEPDLDLANDDLELHTLSK